MANPTTTQKLIITQNPQSNEQFNTLREMFASPEALGILGSLVGLGLLQILNGNFNSKKKLADARWGGSAEKHKAMLKAFEIMERRSHNESALYLGRPKGKGGDGKVIFLPETERGSIALGGSGTGKTVLFHVPMILSAIDQGYSGIILDIKYPTLTEKFAAYAISNGYKLEIFAPGYPESRVLNFMDFIEKGDPSMAAQFAEVFNLNCKKSDKSKGEDSYFGPIGDQVVQSVLMLCKGAVYNGKKYDDLMMAQAILSLPDLPKRIMSLREKINPWVYATFGAMLSASGSEKTVAGIVSSASKNFTTFMNSRFMSALCGESTLPLEIKDKTIVVLGLDRERGMVVAPLIAVAWSLLVSKNLSYSRNEPLFNFGDEIVQYLNIPYLPQWITLNREDGLSTHITAQNIVQCEDRFGKEKAREIFGSCATKCCFNPQDLESAKLISEYCGEEEFVEKQKSHGSSGGKASTNTSEQKRTKKLISPEKVLKLPRGKAIIINPGYESKGEGYVPLLHKFNFSRRYQAFLAENKTLFHSKIRPRLIKNNQQTVLTGQDLQERYQVADLLFSFPKEEKQSQKSQDTGHSSQKSITQEEIAKIDVTPEPLDEHNFYA